MPLDPEQEAKWFVEAISLAPGERGAFLAGLGLEAEDRERLERLWSEEDPEGEAIDQIIREQLSAWTSTAEIAVGQMVGRFCVVKALGSGGTGDVYLVEFEEAGSLRQAALKLIRPGVWRSLDLEVWNRERRFAALVSHPYIAVLIEAGTVEPGWPYLLMEYVEGQRIDEYARTVGQRARVELFDKVCEAVAAAHRKLVVHRDLKPANILIRADGLPKLLDFGIAEAMDARQPTMGGATRNYASPEQLAGEVCTTASDIYSLGIVLEKVVGSDGPAELRAIAAKASQADPEARYEGVGELRADLRRWLEREPVGAYSESVAYRLRCLVRRQWVALSAGLIAAVGIGISMNVAWQQYRKAQEHFRQLRELAGVAIFDFDDSIRNLPGSLGARQLVMENAVRYLRRLEEAAREDRSVREDLASAYQKVAFLQMSGSSASLNHVRESLENLKRSLALRQSLKQGESGNERIRQAYASLLTQLAALSRVSMNIGESEGYLDRALEYARRWRVEAPDSNAALEALIYAEFEETRRLRRRGPEAALEQQRKLAGLVEVLRRRSGDSVAVLKLTGDVYRTLGLLESGTHHAEEAAAAYDKAVAAGVAWQSRQPGIGAIRGLANAYTDGIFGLVSLGPKMLDRAREYAQDCGKLLGRGDLPDAQAEFWVQHRLGLQSAEAHISAASGQRALAERQLEAVGKALDAVSQSGEAKLWASIERVRAATTLAELRRPRR